MRQTVWLINYQGLGLPFRIAASYEIAQAWAAQDVADEFGSISIWRDGDSNIWLTNEFGSKRTAYYIEPFYVHHETP